MQAKLYDPEVRNHPVKEVMQQVSPFADITTPIDGIVAHDHT